MQEDHLLDIEQLITLRIKIQNIIDEIDYNRWSRELSIVKTKLQEAKMWLWMQMWNVGGEDLNAKRDKDLINNKK